MPDIAQRSRSDRSDRCLRDRNVLLDGSGAGSHRSDDISINNDGHTAAEDDDLARVALPDAEQRLTRRGQFAEVVGRLVEDPCRHRLADGEVDASDQGTVLAEESQ